MTIDEIKEQIEVYEPAIVTEQTYDDVGNPTGETDEVGVLRAAVVIDDFEYSQVVTYSPQIYPEVLDHLRMMLVNGLAHDVAVQIEGFE